MSFDLRKGRASVLSAVLMVAWLAAGASRSYAATADAWGPDLILHPSAPCTEDVVTVFVRGYVATPCDSFLSAEKIDERTIRVRTQIYSTRECFAAPFEFFSVPVVMGRFPAGSNEIHVLRETIVRDEIGGVDTTRATSVLTFEVGSTCSTATVPAALLPFVRSVTTVPSPPCPARPVTVRLAGAFLDGCGTVASVDPSTLSLTLAPYPPTPQPCTLALKPWSADFPLGALAAGHFQVSIRMTLIGTNTVWPPVPTTTYVGIFDFDVPRECVGPGVLPYVDHIVLQSPDGFLPCEGDSILVRIGGMLPNSCFRVGIEAVELPYGSPIPMPPLVRLTVADQGCTRPACSNTPVEWERRLVIGPLPVGAQELLVQERRSLGCPPMPDSFLTHAPFSVLPAESCSVSPARCLQAAWIGQSGSCSAFIAPGDSASIALGIVSSVALAGLEGHLRLTGQGARIAGIELAQPFEGMVLQWASTSDGARFVLFASQGAPIPPEGPISFDMVPVLKVTVALAAFQPALGPPPTYLTLTAGGDLLGADEDGNAVPICGSPRELPTAVFCVNGGQCDVNGDGQLDVRDLVLLAHCAVGAQCAEDFPRPDCDGNGWFELGDALCCAGVLLGQPPCPDCPADSVRAAPGIAVSFGAPRSSATGVEVPLRISGSSLVGAARLRFHFPGENLVLAGVDGAPPWLELHQTKGNELTIGLIDVDMKSPRLEGPPLELTLRWTQRLGTPLAGTLSLVDAEWSGADGVKLVVDVGTPTVIFGPVGAVKMTAAHPNPFDASTRFSVQLERPGTLDVGVYDLAGRRVATVFHGRALGGARSFTWSGATDDGAQARGGVYFVHAVADGRSATRRVILVRGR